MTVESAVSGLSAVTPSVCARRTPISPESLIRPAGSVEALPASIFEPASEPADSSN